MTKKKEPEQKPDGVVNDAETLTDEMSDPTNTIQPEVPPVKPGLIDLHGRTFDPNLHVTTPDGQPVITAKGMLKTKGRVKKSTVGGIVKTAGQTVIAPKPEQQAVNICNAYFGLAVQMGGEPWKPSNDEYQSHVFAWTGFCRQHPGFDLPPWLGISICMVSYALPRLDFRKTQGFFAKMKGMVSRRKGGPVEKTEK